MQSWYQSQYQSQRHWFFSVLWDGWRGEGTSPQERGGVSGSLRQNRCFAAHSPALPDPTIYFISSSSVMSGRGYFDGAGDSFREQGSKKVFPPSPSYLFALIDNCAAMGIDAQKSFVVRNSRGSSLTTRLVFLVDCCSDSEDQFLLVKKATLSRFSSVACKDSLKADSRELTFPTRYQTV